MLVPWNDVLAAVDDGLWSMLSTADVVKGFVLRAGGHTVTLRFGSVRARVTSSMHGSYG